MPRTISFAMKAERVQRHGRFTDIRVRPLFNTEKKRLADALALDEPVTLDLTGQINGQFTGVIIDKVGTGYLFRVLAASTRP